MNRRCLELGYHSIDEDVQCVDASYCSKTSNMTIVTQLVLVMAASVSALPPMPPMLRPLDGGRMLEELFLGPLYQAVPVTQPPPLPDKHHGDPHHHYKEGVWKMEGLLVST